MAVEEPGLDNGAAGAARAAGSAAGRHRAAGHAAEQHRSAEQNRSAGVAAERDRLAVRRLLRHFRRCSGRWKTPTGEAWQPALAIDAVINTYERTRDARYLKVIEKSFARYRGRRSHFYDDDGWYLNAWLRAYDVSRDPKYLDEAESIFAGMTEGWDDVCGGGLWWNKDRRYKNAITNELFLLAAARLHRRAGARTGTGRSTGSSGSGSSGSTGSSADNGNGASSYYDWALREWNWFEASGMINASHLVNDGLDLSCANNGGTTWSYNQGVILGGLVELWRITGDERHLDRARQIADAAIGALTDAGSVLREPVEPERVTGDALAFKGLFVQGLARLYDADRASRPEYWAFLTANADSVWNASRNRCNGVGAHWAGPPGKSNAATQAAACLLLGGIALLHAGDETTDVPSAAPPV